MRRRPPESQEERPQEETKPADTLILDLYPPKLWENIFMLSNKPLNLWYIVNDSPSKLMHHVIHMKILWVWYYFLFHIYRGGYWFQWGEVSCQIDTFSSWYFNWSNESRNEVRKQGFHLIIGNSCRTFGRHNCVHFICVHFFNSSCQLFLCNKLSWNIAAYYNKTLNISQFLWSRNPVTSWLGTLWLTVSHKAAFKVSAVTVVITGPDWVQAWGTRQMGPWAGC